MHREKDQALPGGPLISSEAAIIQAEATTKPGFRNSEGCIEAKPRLYQRVAPLPKSVPRNGKSASATKATRKPITANRLTTSGDIIEVSNIARIARLPNTA